MEPWRAREEIERAFFGEAVRQEVRPLWMNEWDHSEALFGPLLLHKGTTAKDIQWGLVNAKNTVQFRHASKKVNQLNKESESKQFYGFG